MGGDSDVAAARETVARRVEFLELLGEGGPLPPRDIVAALSHSRGTVTRALRELREADLVERREEGYSPTLAGTMAAEEYRRYEATTDIILSSTDLLAAIPESHAPPVELLADAETIHADGEVPVRALEAVSDRVRQADRVEAYLPTLVNTHLLRVWHRAVVATGATGAGVFDPGLLTVLKGQYPHLLAEMASTDGFTAFAATGPPYGLIRTAAGDATSVAVVVYGGDTAVRGVLTNDSADAVEWAGARLDGLRSEGADVTDDLAALSGAVADGMARPAREIDSVAPAPAGTATVRAAEGHSLPVALEAEGFVRLSEAYFEAHSVADPAVSWRTGFTLAEVNTGHAVDRLDADGRSLDGRLVEAARSGTDHVVLGPPGSGKSTVCMAAACEWYDRGVGPVLYRERGDGDAFESAPLLEAYLHETDGHALVAVEDAVRDEANAVFGVMQALAGDPGVTFLLDSRTHEWRNPDRFDIDASRDAYRRTAVETVRVPDLDERACERFVDRFAVLVDADLGLSGAELFAMVEAGEPAAGQDALPAGDALVAQHHLARRYDPPVDADASAATALDETVRRTYRTLVDAEVRPAPDLAVLVALLTAAGVPVADEYCYAVTAPEEHADLESALSLLEGRLLFEHDWSRAGSPTAYRTRHETWAVRFIEQAITVESVERVRERVGRSVTRLLSLADEQARRERIQRRLGGRTPHLHRIEADPGGWADELVERMFRLGRANADLAPLFGETGEETVALPAACSAWTRIQRAYWRGEMNLTHGDLARAEREFRALADLAEGAELPSVAADDPPTPRFVSSRAVGDDDLPAHRTRWRATGLTGIGKVAQDRGDYEVAAESHRAAIARFREIGDREGEAVALKNLGAGAFNRGDFDGAREHFERALDIAVELDAERIEADCLNTLGAVATRQSDYDEGREYFERSLVAAREVGDRRGEAARLNNLGVIATHQGAYDSARDYCAASLAIERDLGGRQGEANSLNNLGQVARKQGDSERAREYLEESLAIRRDIGDRAGEATSLVNLGATARERGGLDEARRYLDRALDVCEAIEQPNGVAEVRYERGRLALARGDVDEAREHARSARETFAELGLRVWTARSRLLLGRAAAAADAPADAREHWRAALDTFEAVDAPPETLATLAELVDIARERGDDTRALEWLRRARDVAADAPEATVDRHRDWIEHHGEALGEP